MSGPLHRLLLLYFSTLHHQPPPPFALSAGPLFASPLGHAGSLVVQSRSLISSGGVCVASLCRVCVAPGFGGGGAGGVRALEVGARRACVLGWPGHHQWRVGAPRPGFLTSGVGTTDKASAQPA